MREYLVRSKTSVYCTQDLKISEILHYVQNIINFYVINKKTMLIRIKYLVIRKLLLCKLVKTLPSM